MPSTNNDERLSEPAVLHAAEDARSGRDAPVELIGSAATGHGTSPKDDPVWHPGR